MSSTALSISISSVPLSAGNTMSVVSCSPPPPPPPNAQRLFMILYLIKPVCFCTVCCLLQDGALERVQNTAEALLVAPDISNEVELQVLNSPRLYFFLMVYKSRRCCINNRCIVNDKID